MQSTSVGGTRSLVGINVIKREGGDEKKGFERGVRVWLGMRVEVDVDGMCIGSGGEGQESWSWREMGREGQRSMGLEW